MCHTTSLVIEGSFRLIFFSWVCLCNVYYSNLYCLFWI